MSKQSVAFQKLAQLAQPREFDRQFAMIGEDASKTSCAQNAMVIAKYLTNQSMATGFMTGLKPLVKGGMTKVMTGIVEKKLREPVLIYFMLKFSGAESAGAGDHHFCVFGLDAGRVAVAMGWQNIFTFVDWFSENGQGIYGTGNFLTHLAGIESGSTKSVIDLCAYLGEVKQGTHAGQGVIPVLTSDLSGFRPKVEVCQYLDLP